MIIVICLVLLASLLLSYSNGANDNFKGVATLFGSGTANYKFSLFWATVTTFAGSLCSIILAEKLVSNFSGKGLVPDTLIGNTFFLLSVASGAGLTVLLGTLLGFPISTTHSITGGLIGAGFAAVGTELNLSKLGSSFVLPLLLSPVISAVIGIVLYKILHSSRVKIGIAKELCICIGETKKEYLPVALASNTLGISEQNALTVSVDKIENCVQRYSGVLFGINSQSVLDIMHYASAGIVSFARGLNDTPKIVAILLTAGLFNVKISMLLVALLMAVGGIINASKVAHTMSKKITTLSSGQGFTANITTGFTVIVASILGFPVSTTHVACGALFGLGFVTKNGNIHTIFSIVLSWLLTLPLAAMISGTVFWLVV